MKPSTKQWEELRANWVNGNRSDCRNWFANVPKKTILAVILAAVEEGYQDEFSNGSFVDLIEMIRHLEN